MINPKKNEEMFLKIDSTLANKDLLDEPRAFLLLQICKMATIFGQDVENYWKQLTPLQKKIPKESQLEFENLRAIIDDTLITDPKGFTAELIAEIKKIQDYVNEDINKAKQRLHECEERLDKRRWPTGKTPVKLELIKTWIDIDRKYALQMLKKISHNVRENLIIQINRNQPLSGEEWGFVAKNIGEKETVKHIIKILDFQSEQLILTNELLIETAKSIRKSIDSTCVTQAETEVSNAIKNYSKLLKLHINIDHGNTIAKLLEEIYLTVATTRALDQIWPKRFNFLGEIIELGLSLDTLSDELFEKFLRITPKYLQTFVRVEHVARKVSCNNLEFEYKKLINILGNNLDAQSWFLTILVLRGLGKEAITLAKQSDYSDKLLKRLRMAWLSTNRDSASSAIASEEMSGDSIGEFLAQDSLEQRVQYLRNKTDGGIKSIPGEIWAGKGTENESLGVRTIWNKLKSSNKTFEATLIEYLHISPLYSMYQINIEKDKQFTEILRISGYGEYRYQDVDGALIQTLFAWNETNTSEVKSVLIAMWKAIKPTDDILRVDWLRNAILTRCVNVFSINPEVLIHDFIEWVKKELVEKGKVWRVGKTEFTLKYPDTVPFQYCIMAANTIKNFSGDIRDQIIISGMKTFRLSPPLVEVAAQLFNTGKEVLDIVPPTNLDSRLSGSWQMGVIKNAIPELLKSYVDVQIK